MNVDAKNFTTPLQFVERHSHFFFLEPRGEYKCGPGDGILSEQTATIIAHFQEILPEQWSDLRLKGALESIANTLFIKEDQNPSQIIDRAKTSRASVQHFLRWALTGGRPGPALILTMSILGRDLSLKRIEDAAAVLEKTTSEGNDSLA